MTPGNTEGPQTQDGEQEMNSQRNTYCVIPQISKQTKQSHVLFTGIYSNHKLINKSRTREHKIQDSCRLQHGGHVGDS